MRRLLMMLVGLCLGLCACSDDDADNASAPQDARLRELGDAGGGADGTGSDLGSSDAPTDADAPVFGDASEGDAPTEADGDGGPIGPGPDEPVLGCLTDDDCPGGVCCTSSVTYRSECQPEANCSGGAHDACLTDAQCAARRPGQWSVCCHDRGQRDYCAPAEETCQPLVPCVTFGDCAGQTTDTCCSDHAYYQVRTCTSEFFALNPATDCPR